VKRLEIDLGAPGARRYAADLGRGGLFLPGMDGVVDTEWDLVFVGGETPVGVIARVVLADDTGVGLQLAIGLVVRDRLVAIAEASPDGEGEVIREIVDEDEAFAAGPEPGTELEQEPEQAADEATKDDAEDEQVHSIPKNVYERLRGLNLAQQHKVAREGELSERIALERIYGKTVWELLLRNPRITGPEVARIARKGNLPRPQLEFIVGNSAWLGVPEIRRALLANPRLSAEVIPRVLRHLPKAELKLATTQLAYPALVREAARRMLKSGGREP
jgi:hypothetical protein